MRAIRKSLSPDALLYFEGVELQHIGPLLTATWRGMTTAGKPGHIRRWLLAHGHPGVGVQL